MNAWHRRTMQNTEMYACHLKAMAFRLPAKKSQVCHKSLIVRKKKKKVQLMFCQVLDII